jgi:hypothetical protein
VERIETSSSDGDQQREERKPSDTPLIVAKRARVLGQYVSPIAPKRTSTMRANPERKKLASSATMTRSVAVSLSSKPLAAPSSPAPVRPLHGRSLHPAPPPRELSRKAR